MLMNNDRLIIIAAILNDPPMRQKDENYVLGKFGFKLLKKYLGIVRDAGFVRAQD
jgi:hypothetical protein